MYRVLSYDNTRDLDEAISKKQLEGWKCQGGICGLAIEQSRNSIFINYGTGYLFMQAIVKEDS
jgi:hypothetical protein